LANFIMCLLGKVRTFGDIADIACPPL
jgi:hypothetical protein